LTGVPSAINIGSFVRNTRHVPPQLNPASPGIEKVCNKYREGQ
jgi:hypothetical protein